ncbi:zinc finger protein AEBP2 isoform X1 [Bufo bufo]|uniref:zinc finger protein AEBP2 isoform X1 n=1 Tax=Bufo bufo TaxID=8384 RepID=UPI001ABE3D61|nr:zinc finger protein AEBP2 isoform X1 [Bufo bufo]
MAAFSAEQQPSSAGSPSPTQAAAPEPHEEQAAGRGDPEDDEEEEEEEEDESSGVSERSDSPAGSSMDGETGSNRPDDGPSSGSSAPSTAGSTSGGDDGYSSASQSSRRTSLGGSSEGEPLSRMDSEDSISSTLMDVDSIISSGRSTPSMMNVLGISASSAKSLSYACCWDQCQACFSSSPDLAEHIRTIHVDGQRGGVFICFWKGCKVYNTPSTSQSWLQRHMLTHSGDKPFKCVVGGCNASFASQGGLARHVPTHFSQQNSSKVSGHHKSKEESPSKAGLNRRRKLKNKRKRSLTAGLGSTPYTSAPVQMKARPHDFFDAQTLDAIRHRAICFNLSAQIESLGNGHSVVFHSTVIAKRKEDSGKIKLLLHWTPEDILPDVWVNETDCHQLKTKVVHLSKLPKDTAHLLDPNIYRDSSKRITPSGSLADHFS